MMLTSARQIGIAIENVKTTVAVVATIAIMMLFENLEYPTAIALVSAALTARWVKWQDRHRTAIPDVYSADNPNVLNCSRTER